MQWNIKNSLSGTENGIQLLNPNYATQLLIDKGDNPLLFFPEDIDDSFDFYTGDNAFYGFVKVVEDLKKADVDAIKEEVGKFETLIWPPEKFQLAGGGDASGLGGGLPRCH